MTIRISGEGLSRRAFLAAMSIAMTGAGVDAFQANAGARRIPLFNGKDLSGWYTYLRGFGKNNDPKHVFSVRDAMLYVTGEVNGGLITEQEYENYRLVAEYKWGTRMWPPRENDAMDSGIFLHCGNEDAVAMGSWPQNIEFQIYQGAVGDLVLLPGKGTLTATIEGEQRGNEFQHVPGAPAQVRQAGGTKRFDVTAHFGKDPEWK